MDNNVKIMGILNVTPDSFFDGGRYFRPEKAVARGMEMVHEGAHIIDVGGESTRPGAEPVSEAEERDRVCPVIESLAKKTDIPLSIDTTKSRVAEDAVRAGASIINDISGLTFDPEIAHVAARYGTGLVISHIKGTPRDMQVNPVYHDLMAEICEFLSAAATAAMAAGVAREKIIIDPGIGFGKSLDDNYRIIAGIGWLKELGFPVLIGLSNKSLIHRLQPEGSDRLPGTIALNAAAVMNGADIIRVHDVRAHVLMMHSISRLKKVS